MIGVGLESLVDENAVSLLAGLVLQWQGDEVAEAATGHGVLVREEAVVRVHAQLVASAHGLGDEIAAHPPRDARRHGRREEEPRVGAVPGAGALHRDGNADGSAGLGEGGDVLLPRALVEVGRQKPAGLVLEQRIDADDVSPLKVIEDHLIAHGNEGLVRAVATPAAGLQRAQPWFPLVRACGRVPWFTRLLAHEPGGEDVDPSAEQVAEQAHLLGRRVRRPFVRIERKLDGDRRGRGRRVELQLKRRDAGLRLVSGTLDFRESSLLVRQLRRMSLRERAMLARILTEDFLFPNGSQEQFFRLLPLRRARRRSRGGVVESARRRGVKSGLTLQVLLGRPGIEDTALLFGATLRCREELRHGARRSRRETLGSGAPEARRVGRRLRDRRALSCRRGFEKVRSDHTLPDVFRLFSPADRMVGDIEPALEHVCRRHGVGMDRAPEHRLWEHRFAHEDVDLLSRRCWHQLEFFERGIRDFLQVHVHRSASDEPKSQPLAG